MTAHDQLMRWKQIALARRLRLREVERQLTLIGERAVVDWDDETVGKVDAAVPPQRQRTYAEWLRGIMDIVSTGVQAMIARRKAVEERDRLAAEVAKYRMDCPKGCGPMEATRVRFHCRMCMVDTIRDEQVALRKDLATAIGERDHARAEQGKSDAKLARARKALAEALTYTACAERPHCMPPPWMPVEARERCEAIINPKTKEKPT